MKRVVFLIAIVAVGFACCLGGFSGSAEFASAVAGKLSPAIEKVKQLAPEAEKVEGLSSALEKVKELLPAGGGVGETDDAGGTGWTGEPSEPGEAGEAGEPGEPSEPEDLKSLDDAVKDSGSAAVRSLLSLGSGLASGALASVDDVTLVPTDDYGQGYVFDYDGEQFTAYFDTYSWRVYESYKITNHEDIVIICQALLDEHVVYGSDWATPRTADDMAFEWEQHNLAYQLLPEGNHWRDDAKDVDLDPDDQGKTFPEMYERRTGRKLDLRNYL